MFATFFSFVYQVKNRQSVDFVAVTGKFNVCHRRAQAIYLFDACVELEVSTNLPDGAS